MDRLEIRRTWLDRVLEHVAPVTAARRLRARAALDALSRHYEGATRGPRTKGWRTSATSAAGASIGALSTLRDRSRDLIRNNGWATEAQRVTVGNIVGPGIVPRFLVGPGAPQQVVDRVREAWQAWAGDSCECHHLGAADLVGVEELVAGAIFESGEVLVRRRPRRAADGLSVPLQLEILEPDMLDETRDTTSTGAGAGGRILQGVQFDALGRREGYWLLREHPGDPWGWRSLESRFVPASEVAHVYLETRPGQVRGVPHLAPAMIALRDLDEAEDARLIREKIAACFTAFRRMSGESDELHDDDDEDEITTLRPGMVYRLEPGEEVSFGNPPASSGFDEYAATVLRKVAAATGLTYEELTGDYRRVNFSSGRMGWVKSSRHVRRFQRAVRSQLLGRVYAWWLEAAILAGVVDERARAVRVSWDLPRREMLDPTKETAARLAQVRAGFMSWSDAVRDGGRDPHQVAEELAADAALMSSLGLRLDSDPARASAPPGSPPPAEDEDEELDEDELEDDTEDLEDEDERGAVGREAAAGASRL